MLLRFEGDSDLIKAFRDKFDFLQQDEPTIFKLRRSKIPSMIDVDGINPYALEITVGPDQSAQNVADIIKELTLMVREMDKLSPRIDKKCLCRLKKRAWSDFQEKMK